jgi:hypothetical protein
MFEWIIVFCLASDFHGRPVNQCFGMESAETYLSEVECQVVMRQRTDWVMKELSQSSDGRSPVVTGVCGEATDGL